MSKIFLFILIFFSFVATAQQKDYIYYNQQIQKAENHIIDSSYKKAIKVYKKLYKNYSKTFVRDDINAMVCALLINDYKSAVFFDKRRIQKNTPLPNLLQTELEKYYQTAFYQSAKQELDSLKNYGETIRKSSNLARLYDSLYRKDQEVRQKPNYIDGKDTTIIITDSLNLIATAKLLTEKGYPNDIEWGKSQPLDIILRHNTMYSDGTLLPLIYEEVKKGNYDMNEYVFHYDTHSQHTVPNNIKGNREKAFEHLIIGIYYSGVWAVVNNRLYALKFDKLREKQTNKARKLLGFGTLQEAYKKQLFSTKNQYFEFVNPIIFYRHGSPRGRVGQYFDNILAKHFELVPLNLVGSKFIVENGIVK